MDQHGNQTPAVWIQVYTTYCFYANLGDPARPSTNISFIWADPLYPSLFAYSSISRSTTVIATDMLLFSGNPWSVRSNHIDNRAHTIYNQYHGYNQRFQGYGLNVVYNDGHVIWKRAEDTQVHFEVVYNLDTAFAF
jgi:prepilin-type processing-associated H-X9-DG protein